MGIVAPKRSLLAASRAIERRFFEREAGPIAGIVTFQRDAFFTASRPNYFRWQARCTDVVLAFSGAPGVVPHTCRLALLPPDHALAIEWVVLLVSANASCCLSARDLGDPPVPDLDRRFDATLRSGAEAVEPEAERLLRLLGDHVDATTATGIRRALVDAPESSGLHALLPSVLRHLTAQATPSA